MELASHEIGYARLCDSHFLGRLRLREPLLFDFRDQARHHRRANLKMGGFGRAETDFFEYAGFSPSAHFVPRSNSPRATERRGRKGQMPNQFTTIRAAGMMDNPGAQKTL
jgi:hypothetical protein